MPEPALLPNAPQMLMRANVQLAVAGNDRRIRRFAQRVGGH